MTTEPKKRDLFAGVVAPEAIQDDTGRSLKPCFLCESNRARRLYMQAHFPVVRCLECGLVHADEHFQDEDLTSFYSGDYYQRAYVCHPAEINCKIAQDYVRAFGRVDRELKGGRLLDFGSARGTFLGALRAGGYEDRWTLEGVDVNPDEVQMGEEEGLPVRCIGLEEAGYPDGAFDCVTAFSVIEHLQKPAIILQEIARVTRTGGELLLIVPSGRCLIIGLALIASRVFGRRIRGFTDNVFHEEHLYYFTPDTMTRALEKAGFEVRSIFYEPSYLETHPPGILTAVGAYVLRFLSWALRRQTMLGVVARRR